MKKNNSIILLLAGLGLCILPIKTMAQSAKEWFNKAESNLDTDEKRLYHYQKALLKGYDPAKVYFGIANIYKYKNYEEALKYYQKASTEGYKPIHKFYFEKYRFYIKWEKYQEALTELNQFIDKGYSKRDYQGIYNIQANLYMFFEQYTKAIKIYDKALKEEPKNWHCRAYIRRGDAYSILGNFTKAIQDYDSALANCKDNLVFSIDMVGMPDIVNIQKNKQLAVLALSEQNALSPLPITNQALTNFQVQKTKLLVSQYISFLNSFQDQNKTSNIYEQSMLIGLFEDRNLMVFNDLDKSIEYEEIYAYLMRLKINRGKYQFKFHENPENQEVSIYKEKYSSLVISKTIQTQTGSQKIKLRFIIKPESNKIVGIAKEN